MACYMIILQLCILAMAALQVPAKPAAAAAPAKLVNMTVYMHDIVSGPNRTAIRVAGTNVSSSKINFGDITVIDDLVTQGPQNTSTVVGRAQGIYVNCAISATESNLLLLFSLVFQSAPYNGSTLQIQGADRTYLANRDVAIVGGTGAFQLAKGFATMSTITPEILKFRLQFYHL